MSPQPERALRQVALLRGVNVGRRKRVPMAELRELVASLGGHDVATLIQSGNVVFSAARPLAAATLEAELFARFGFPVAVALRTADELAAALAANPLRGADAAALHVGFLTAPPAAGVLEALDGAAFLPERFALAGSEVYLELPAGVGRARLPAALDRRASLTLRSWRTLEKLVALARG